MKWVKDIYRATQDFAREEIYGLTSQLRRTFVSVPGNIADGPARNSRREFHQFVGHARGSLQEVETQLEIARALGYLLAPAAAVILSEANEVGHVRNGLRAWSAKARTDS